MRSVSLSGFSDVEATCRLSRVSMAESIAAVKGGVRNWRAIPASDWSLCSRLVDMELWSMGGKGKEGMESGEMSATWEEEGVKRSEIRVFIARN
jgi:hypothetical protein